MPRPHRVLGMLTCLSLTGCAIGLGPSSAASRPVLGFFDDVESEGLWEKADNQEGVPSGMVRLVYAGSAMPLETIFRWVSITTGGKKGSADATVGGAATGSAEVIELELGLAATVPMPIGNLLLGAGHQWVFEDGDAALDTRGFAVRASFAPIAQISLDVSRAFLDGTVEHGTTTSDVDGGRWSVGTTVVLFGYKHFRWGLAVARTWTDLGAYTSSGYTYQLVGTMY